MGEPDIVELAVAAWRLERWLENLNAERKMAAKKSLREIKRFLDASDIEIVDPLGWRFDPGLAVEVINNEAEDADEEELIIIQTNSPIVKLSGSVIQYGKVILGLDIKTYKANNEVKSDSKKNSGEQGQTENDTASKEKGALLKQSQLYVDESESCWIKIFDCKAIRNDYQAIIVVESNVDTEVLLMDEQVYKNYCKGIPPKSPFKYKPKAGASFIALPYPDIWYMLAWPPVGHGCREYIFDMNCEWMRKSDIAQANANRDQYSDSNPQRDSGVSGNACDNESSAVNPQTNRIGEEQHKKRASADGVNKKRKVPDLSEKEIERLRKKNLTAYAELFPLA